MAKAFHSLHPAVLVTAGCVLLIALQCLTGMWFHAIVLLLTTLAFVCDRARLWRLCRRLRYVLLAVVVLFAWQTPGTLIVPAAGAWSPTVDGLSLALDHTLKLLAVVDVVTILMAWLLPEQWVAGLYVLAWPLRLLGVSPERFAVRLNLVLRDADSRASHDWRYWLDESPGEQTEAAWHVAMPSMFDMWLLTGLVLIGIGELWWLA